MQPDARPRLRPSWPALLLAGVLLAAAAPTFAADPAPPTTVTLSAEGQDEADNDLAVATLFAEASAPQAGDVARRVNAAIATALAKAQRVAEVKVRTGTSQTFPIYGKNGRAIEAWRMRTDLRLESRNLAALAQLVADLQGDLALAEMALQPAPETRRRAEERATRSALDAFQKRAGMIATALGKNFRLRHLDVGTQGHYPPPRPMARLAMADAAPPPLPVEPGTTAISTTVSGTIELID